MIDNKAAFASMVLSLLLIGFGISTVFGIIAMAPTLAYAEASEGELGAGEQADGTGVSFVTILQFIITPRSSIISLLMTVAYWIGTVILAIKGLKGFGHKWMAVVGLILALGSPVIIFMAYIMSFSILSAVYY